MKTNMGYNYAVCFKSDEEQKLMHLRVLLEAITVAASERFF